MIDIKILHTGWSGVRASCGQWALSVQKNEKITRILPILTSNFQ